LYPGWLLTHAACAAAFCCTVCMISGGVPAVLVDEPDSALRLQPATTKMAAAIRSAGIPVNCVVIVVSKEVGAPEPWGSSAPSSPQLILKVAAIELSEQSTVAAVFPAVPQSPGVALG
jgi:hypothetical protein